MAENTILTESEARLAKVAAIREHDGVVWKDKFDRRETIAAAREMQDGAAVKTAGRITALRWLGKLTFGRISDIEGEIQFSLSLSDLGEDNFRFLKANLDMGDFIGITGELYHTTQGELTIKGASVVILSKALRSLPEKFHGLSDTETRYRQRYLDIISNQEVRDTFNMRFKFLKFFREFMWRNGFVELETPILQNVAGGAAAKPFITHHNALDADFYLRISPELYLKQAIAAGFTKVFEIAKDFRNEGMDPQHLQEFTMVEWYAAYWDFEDNIALAIKLFQESLMELKGTLQIPYQGKTLDFSKFARIDYIKEVSEKIGFDILSFDDLNAAKKIVVDKGLFHMGELKEIKSVMGLVDYVWKKKIRAFIVQPTIVCNYPAFMKPLARRNDQDARRTDAFQIVVDTAEIINAYSELVDPIEQRRAFEEQMKNKEAGEEEGFELDEDFLRAMEHGMPPVSGFGFGFDRFMTMLTDQPNVRDIILFPLMK
ncbi:MAG: lysine--tRNA ligase [Rickettsiales bacterium]|jgi:lysyl-tRNA synthetase class 2|nr:lysine--tRNA ligase [Rickettsiales bacterium]